MHFLKKYISKKSPNPGPHRSTLLIFNFQVLRILEHQLKNVETSAANNTSI